MRRKNESLFHELPWTHEQTNMFGAPWDVVEIGFEDSRRQGYVLLQNCFNEPIALTARTKSSIAANEFAAEAMNACGKVCRIVSQKRTRSWSREMVGEIDALYRTFHEMIPLLSGLYKGDLAGDKGRKVVRAWQEALSEDSREAVLALHKLHSKGHEAALAVERGWEPVSKDVRFVPVVLGNAALHIATSQSPFAPLIHPCRSDDPIVLGRFSERRLNAHATETETSSSLYAMRAAWEDVILPSMNSFLRLQQDGIGTPKMFPRIVLNLFSVREEITKLGGSLNDVAPEQSRKLSLMSGEIIRSQAMLVALCPGGQSGMEISSPTHLQGQRENRQMTLDL